MIRKFIKNIFGIVFPNHCIICGNMIESEKMNYICIDCINKKLDYIHKDDYTRCERCGKLIEDKNKTCACKYEEIYFDECKSMLYYKGITIDLIHKMKFSHRYLICSDFGAILSFYYKDYIKKFDAVTFVPLGKNRFLERGYNQSEIIAKTISKILNIKLIENIIGRKKETYPLSMIKDKELRKSTIKDAFKINKNFKNNLKEKINILIIDDVFTTGATLNEISSEIRKIENIGKIGVLTVARVYTNSI
ncbi:ComF family protein [Brachyspira sp.]|uniref:ComF family protein n=1 Tax=Brachyspira sp. TaxID=1977261 RepID=UPI003D7ED435